VTLVRFAVRTTTALLTLALLLLVVAGLRVWWFARADSRPTSDVIVVMGAAQFDGRPSSILTARLDHARKLFADGVAPRVITVGGNREGDRFTEADAGKAWLTRHGVPARRVVAVGTGTDTLTSVRAVARRMGEADWVSAVVVTDPWHSLRTRTMARDAGIDAEASPTRQGPAVRTRKTQLRYVVREALAYSYYEVVGGSLDLGKRAV
jgi:uncharacterized SAM-binding protein YcdF (DUF218 family)